jgi:hypothetical protein
MRFLSPLPLVESQPWGPGHEEKKSERAKASEEFISQKSDKLGLAMVRYVYGEGEELGARRGRRRRSSDWEI